MYCSLFSRQEEEEAMIYHIGTSVWYGATVPVMGVLKLVCRSMSVKIVTGSEKIKRVVP
jgi:hypothetical protein